ncbi:virulence factor Mce family protein [Mycobacterium sp. M26]|uniref:virulence factor Mce family protein n=1 Tax=Mycobacterium sp. M26 TaxID=1762962 RepID=UPI00073E29D0|nr:virulence factor Mce family protein [Mycobacterium sp. M26]
MRENLRGTLWRVAAFLTLCAVGIFAIVAVFGQLRFERQQTYNALFSNVSGLKGGNFVRIAGVEVGKVKKITVRDDSTVDVVFGVDNSVELTEGNRAVIRYQNLTGERYLALEEGPGGVRRLQPGQTIPLDRTQPALDINALIGGFRPLFRAIDPEQVNALSNQLIQVFQGQGDVINSFLDQTAALTNTLADRDQLISQVIDNLNTVLDSIGGQAKQLDKAVDSVSQLVRGLADRKSDVANGIAYTNAAAASVADLLATNRAPLKEVVHQTDRVAGTTMSDKDYFDHLLDDLPNKYQILSRLGLYGDFFSFYLCDLILKINGKGGQPVFVKVAGQDTGRCAPK